MDEVTDLANILVNAETSIGAQGEVPELEAAKQKTDDTANYREINIKSFTERSERKKTILGF